jgi:hypothetical protein
MRLTLNTSSVNFRITAAVVVLVLVLPLVLLLVSAPLVALSLAGRAMRVAVGASSLPCLRALPPISTPGWPCARARRPPAASLPRNPHLAPRARPLLYLLSRLTSLRLSPETRSINLL